MKNRAKQERGDAKRIIILEAAIRVIAQSGTGALTHRAVAGMAQVPLASTTYYFSSKSDLLLSAFEHLAEKEIHALKQGMEDIPLRLTPEFAAGWWASMVADDLMQHRERILAEYEMHLETNRQPELRAVHQRWSEAAYEFFKACMKNMGSKDPQADGALVLCVIAGIQIGELADATPHLERDLLGPLFRRLLHALVPA